MPALSKKTLQEVLRVFQKWFPESYADSAWDNTGLLLNCATGGTGSTGSTAARVLLTVDLTRAVAQEAVDQRCNLVIAYHPFVFPSWRFIDGDRNPQHASAIQLIQQGVSVYSPHTAMDAASGGINDWLALGCVAADDRDKIVSMTPIESVAHRDAEDAGKVGYGRLVSFRDPTPLSLLIQNVKCTLGVAHVQVALPDSVSDTSAAPPVSTVALCAGSGSSVFKNIPDPNKVDVYLTGELSHHELLRIKESGKVAIVCNHSNTERRYLREVLLGKLQSEGIDCIVSERDRDPLVLA
ncbi:uncharacterized protein KNAG_0B00480 [Huiozyma naganishii CBS 8797]|uniref:YbgI/family dinuclear metal center protein n=1 Tax=Huiozyma naganishii (strain ATCC MYA-139 / BCRC 22969 / CBS 8797 / KCTC 17520 / NBRC 10181 / NCYC 3082 / Yp74L-3) TaxID=1071383 RepID=J7RUK4_HUIN7|nr:hypothetical protein KNAG_0B00480 [Kazachstania naganishii CBS 8797]CCK68497.1 hypothetical protein KNAG_0B00480 [Kazachstania naganishii CBS 8797]